VGWLGGSKGERNKIQYGGLTKQAIDNITIIYLMKILLRSLGIKDNFSNYYTYYNGFYYINYAAIDEYLWNKAVSNLNNNNYIVQ